MMITYFEVGDTVFRLESHGDSLKAYAALRSNLADGNDGPWCEFWSGLSSFEDRLKETLKRGHLKINLHGARIAASE